MRLVGVLLLLAYGAAGAQVQNTTTIYQYDPMGNLIRIIDPLGNTIDQSYDGLNRMVQQTQPAPAASAARPSIVYAYDGLDQLTSVQDPRNLVTTYTVDGLGNQTGISSPDTGVTAKTYNAAGYLATSTDAKGQTTSYQYDVLNRVTSIVYADGSSTAFAYDQGANGIGRLTQVTDASGITRYVYDAFGHLLAETRTINGVDYVTAYSYDDAGRLAGLTYPSGRVITYGRDAMGRVSQIDTAKDGASTTLVSQVSYYPFGEVKSFLNGANVTVTRGMDTDGRITGYTLSSSLQSVSYDAASRVTAIADATTASTTQTYEYDGLSRLVRYIGSGPTQILGYDAVGNRTSRKIGSSDSSYGYETASNRLAQITGGTTQAYQYDANGSATTNGAAKFGYDVRGRLVSVTTGSDTAQYRINALGQRIQKTVSGTAIVFHYDHAGRLIGERKGTADKDYVYLGDIPVAVLQ
jgi:YD repeat-containing protein